MDQVSSFFENILAVEPNDADKPIAESTSKESESSLPSSNKKEAITSNSKKRRSDLDFSSFWYKPDDTKKSSISNSLVTDKLMEKIISMVIPMNIEDEQHNRIINGRMQMQSERPSLSINLMSKNSIQLTQRLSSVFSFVDNVIKFFNWYNPYYTVGVLLVLTHIILNPYLISAVPFFLIISNIFVPHYLVIYPPDNSILNDYFKYNPVPSNKPLLAYKASKPVPEFSKEFILNLTDLQNHMVLYVVAYDFLLWLGNDYLFFKDEKLTSLVLIALIGLTLNNLIVLPKVVPALLKYLPIKVILILNIWLITGLFHPAVRTRILDWYFNEETRLRILNINNTIELYLTNFLEDDDNDKDVVKQVEIFELQKLNSKTKIWELVGFTNNLYTISSPIRALNKTNEEDQEDEETSLSRIEINKKLSINEIKPPKNWEFIEKNWKLDLNVNQWVENNLIEDLVYIDDYEKWVYDYQNEKSTNNVFRRRRWIRNCRRENLINKNTSDNNDENKSGKSG